MDLWVEKTEDNYKRIVDAFHDFEMPIFDMTKEIFLNNPNSYVFTFGRPPIAIDILTNVKGLKFEEAYSNKLTNEIEVDLFKYLINYNDLITSKKAAGRSRDLNDIENLEL